MSPAGVRVAPARGLANRLPRSTACHAASHAGPDQIQTGAPPL